MDEKYGRIKLNAFLRHCLKKIHSKPIEIIFWLHLVSSFLIGLSNVKDDQQQVWQSLSISLSCSLFSAQQWREARLPACSNVLQPVAWEFLFPVDSTADMNSQSYLHLTGAS